LKVTYISQFKKIWNGLASNTREIYLFLHGGSGAFKGKTMNTNAIKKLSFKKLKSVNVLTCKGALGGKASVAYAFHCKLKKAKVYAAGCKISYRLGTNGKWYPSQGGKKYFLALKTL